MSTCDNCRKLFIQNTEETASPARAAPPAGATAYRWWLASDVYFSSSSLHNPHLIYARTHFMATPPRFVCRQHVGHIVVCLIGNFGSASGQNPIIRSRGVTVSTLDPESSDRGSNPRETSLLLRCPMCACVKVMKIHMHVNF